jgi:hypothetical protein
MHRGNDSGCSDQPSESCAAVWRTSRSRSVLCDLWCRGDRVAYLATAGSAPPHIDGIFARWFRRLLPALTINILVFRRRGAILSRLADCSAVVWSGSILASRRRLASWLADRTPERWIPGVPSRASGTRPKRCQFLSDASTVLGAGGRRFGLALPEPSASTANTGRAGLVRVGAVGAACDLDVHS